MSIQSVLFVGVEVSFLLFIMKSLKIFLYLKTYHRGAWVKYGYPGLVVTSPKDSLKTLELYWRIITKQNIITSQDAKLSQMIVSLRRVVVLFSVCVGLWYISKLVVG
ncbi:MAG: hypothetical protein A2951_01335 [Candidatus Buchananbacteria bacterium RIFCSPLOWO2_01_FULL_56_15]|uniref:Uncharacterized protein n=2 Tax=Candidatus Buchananiibacteriota TaxID=1817903 RepID=A0A1G1YFD0_9BACT|nr:MAG: hypothetical protein A3J59_01675 [Candidatus Buchananbacteria bacterium RIFCSPHIGHO2_02_FULL_56_16]OGY54603.1 MAG: hypothetical protein A2951_01335 [Candidatus Buchananbacteria bacterium RIFCSPLOWO2_01_FULL_56_15]